ncbi:unnamed protein product [Rotaria sordida]|uniref:NmrA-like domain-containing protein n=1 Tax=Rotaria sordida TaxID=392033 RepID=A0A815VXV2_9BILA|nr:unnamed protein product [Rotaria sordida]CAF1536318.1 unnamed protein product [Rotaria sordida]
MSTSKEHIFVVGASGDIGSGIVRGLVKKDEILTGCLTIVVGTYSSVEVYEKAIEGHTRLFLLAVGNLKRPTEMSEIKETFGKIAYEKGVRQIVDLSSWTVRSLGRQGIIGYMHTTSEEKLWKLADERPDERSLVVLRPGVFMSNQLMSDVNSVKHLNKLVSCGPPSSTFAWIDTKDISDCSVVVLTEPVEKHDRCVYEMGGEFLTQEQRAAIFSKVLGRSITYEQQPVETLYKMFIGFGMPHSLAYDIVSFPIEPVSGHVTPQLSILINRPLRTLEEWLRENVKEFQ